MTEVRERATALADDASAKLLLIDGPPGVGCPVIAATTNTDLVVAVAEPTLSGEHDLERLIDLAGRFDIPVAVLLNKADLSAEGAARIREVCARRGLPLLGEVPFDERMARVLDGMARGEELGDSAGGASVSAAWERVEELVGLS